MDERQLNPFERYQSYVEFLKLPQFDSLEEAESKLQVVESGDIQFIVRGPQGVYTIYAARLINGKFSKRKEFLFSHGDLWILKREAALALGMELLE